MLPLEGLGDGFGIGIEVDQSDQSRIGLECYIGNVAQPDKNSLWQLFIDYLYNTHLVSQSKSHALLHMSHQVVGFAPHGITMAIQGINHVKISIQGSNSPLEVKAYLHHYPASKVNVK